MKRCSRCKVEKPESDFPRYQGKFHSWCRPCMCAASKAYYHGLSERKRKELNRRGHAATKASGAEKQYRKRAIERYQTDHEFRQRFRNAQGGRIHGVTPEEYAERRSRPCAICGVFKHEPGKRGSGMHIDHDHATGQLRGTLCARCNRGIGMFDDRIELLTRAAAYLSEWTK